MMTYFYNSYFYKKWEFFLSYILTFGKVDNSKLFMRNFSFVIVISFGTFFFQLRDGSVMQEFPEILKSIFSAGFFLVIACYSKIIIFDQKIDKNTISFTDSTYKNSLIISELIKKDEKSLSNNFLKSEILLDNQILFDENLINKLKEIIENLKITKPKQFTYLLYCLKEKMFCGETDKKIINQFNDILNINISPQFFSQIKNEIEYINKSKNLSKKKEKYLKLYNDINYNF